MNKFQVAVVTPVAVVAAKSPRIAACLTHIECRIVDTLEMGDQAVGKSAGGVHNGRCGSAALRGAHGRGQP
ncbi:MAG: hypothetical protein ACXV2E_07180 [Halobacteriota archaeon]